MRKAKGIDITRPPQKAYPFLMPVVWMLAGVYSLLGRGTVIEKRDPGNIRPPYLLLSNHASMIDFAIAARVTFPYRINWVISVEEFVGRDWALRGIGGMYKRKFTAEMVFIRHMVEVLKKRKRICVMYPEARFSLAGVNERISSGIGKLVKMSGCPVVVVIEYGSFLREPQWNKKPARKVPVRAVESVVVSSDEVKTLSAEEIQNKIEKAIVYDDYKWQRENRIRINSRKRAHNIHRILYQCPVCKKEFGMNSKDTDIWCEECGARWTMDEYGVLHSNSGNGVFDNVPDWYRWERENVIKEVNDGEYRFEDDVRIDKLVNFSKGFEKIGMGKMVQDGSGITVQSRLDSGEDFLLHRTAQSMESCHIEYDFRKRGTYQRGPAIDLTDKENTYFVFPVNKGKHLTKIHFATEALYDKSIETKKVLRDTD